MRQARVPHDEGIASLTRLRAELKDVPEARKRAPNGAPSVVEYLDNWWNRVFTNQMTADALPELYAWQALRHDVPAVAGPLKRERDVLLKAAGSRPGYGARWWFGPRID